MPVIDLSNAGSGLRNIEYTVATSSETVFSQYDIWADDIGLSSTGSDYPFLSGNNSAVSPDFFTKLWEEQATTDLEISTEGGLFIHIDGLASGAAVQLVSVANINRMIGWNDPHHVLFSWHIRNSNMVATSASRMRERSGIVILYLVYEFSGAAGVTVSEVAVRLTGWNQFGGLGKLEIIGNTLSGITDFYISSQDSVGTFNTQALMLAQSPGSTDIITMDVVEPNSGVDETPSILDLDLVGGLSDPPVPVSETPNILTIDLIGIQPVLGLIFIPAPLQLIFSGNTPNLILGYINDPIDRLSIYISGGIPNSVNAQVPTLNVVISKLVPTFGFIVTKVPFVLSKRISALVTGSQDSLEDVELPISTLSYRLEEEGNSSTQISVPNGAENFNKILDRPNGLLKIVFTDIMSDQVSVVTVSLGQEVTNIQASQGSGNYSIVLNSIGVVPLNTAVKEYIASEVSLITTQNGSLRARLTPISDFGLGDSLRLADGRVIIASSVVTTINKSLSSMEVSNG